MVSAIASPKGKVGLTDVAISTRKPPADLPETSVRLDEALIIDDIMLDGSAEEVGISTITVDGLAVAGWQEGQRISLAGAVPGTQPLPSRAQPVPKQERHRRGSCRGRPRQWRRGWLECVPGCAAQLVNSSLRWRSEFTDPSRSGGARRLKRPSENVTWPLSGDSQLSLALAANQQARIALDGVLALAQGDGSINYSLDGLPLTWFNPNLPAALKAHVYRRRGSRLQADVALGELRAHANRPGRRDHASFLLTREGAKESLTGWETVRLEGLAVDMEENHLVLQKLAIDNYKGRLHIARDGSINAMNVWKAEVGEAGRGNCRRPHRG